MGSPAWQKSSYSGSSNACVEVRAIAGVLELRESDEGEVVVRMAPLTFAALLQGARAGEFDHLTTSA
ncbi:DUF397 domain-containing protein [Streptomyces rubellomurinus]|uniref:DUF397 domain-containing protein n=1 Tax=Streptomyces sp. Y1 TaxID=3238634 RepID=A0AB39TKY7_9ACTN|nr:hypothetical protein VM98_05945 [Streptomyces rubellomurinus subsp. indigoferus]